jgi:DNA-binding transcriptional LysR family regulator
LRDPIDPAFESNPRRLYCLGNGFQRLLRANRRRGDSHATDACLAALAQQHAVEKLRKHLSDVLGLRRDLPEFSVRMGLATGDLVGQLCVYCRKGVGQFIAPVVTGFLSQYPEVSVDLRDGDAMIDLVHERFDLAIMPVSLPHSTPVRRTLAKWRYVLCSAPAYLKKHPEPCSPADLTGHNCLLYAYAPFSDQWPFLDARGNTGIARVSATLVTTSITVLRRAAIVGLGLWLSPPFVISDLLASKELVPLLRDNRLPEMEIVALYPDRRHLTAKTRAFIDMLADQFSNEQRWPGTPAN